MILVPHMVCLPQVEYHKAWPQDVHAHVCLHTYTTKKPVHTLFIPSTNDIQLIVIEERVNQWAQFQTWSKYVHFESFSISNVSMSSEDKHLSASSTVSFWREEFAFYSLLYFQLQKNSKCSVEICWLKEGRKERMKEWWKWCVLRSHRSQTHLCSITFTQILHSAFLNLMEHVTHCDNVVSVLIHFVRSRVDGIFYFYKNILFASSFFTCQFLEFKSY
jgi:hypothetical protein